MQKNPALRFVVIQRQLQQLVARRQVIVARGNSLVVQIFAILASDVLAEQPQAFVHLLVGGSSVGAQQLGFFIVIGQQQIAQVDGDLVDLDLHRIGQLRGRIAHLDDIVQTAVEPPNLHVAQHGDGNQQRDDNAEPEGQARADFQIG